jgi:Spermine/spermidine synthase domain
MNIESSGATAKRGAQLMFLSSFLLIFGQLALIRYVGSEVGVFAYLQNILLTSCFIGFSVGLRAPRSSAAGKDFCEALSKIIGLIVVVGLVADWSFLAVAVSALGQSYVAWNIFHVNEWSVGFIPLLVAGLSVIFCMLMLTALVFAPLGSLVGSCFETRADPLTPYLYNIAGSIAGVLAFYAASYLSLGPQWWLLCMGCCALSITPASVWRRGWHRMLAFVPALLVAGSHVADANLTTFWSPYQKLNLTWVTAPPFSMEGGYIRVNNSGYQIMLDLRPSTLAAKPALYTRGWEGYTHYDLPFRFRPHAQSALILGAGSGNDAAAAVRADVSSVVAVDIDPVIVGLGRDAHPERPYADGRVHVEVTDARSFLYRTGQKFDVISFGLLDSHTGGAMTNARLDHFVYTRESFQAVASRLAPGGVVTLMFEASKPYIAARMAAMLRDVFGHSPIIFRVPPSAYGFGGVMLVTGDQDAIQGALENDQKLRSIVLEGHYGVPGEAPEVTTDDWPYVYLDKRTIPPLFGVSALMMFGLLRRVRRRCSVPSPGRPSRDEVVMALLGAAFLLLEVAQISRTAALLGISWQPSAAIILGILSMAFLSTLWARSRAPSMLVSGGLLIASLIFLLVFDLNTLLSLSYKERFLAAGMVTCLPVFFSGLVFSSVLKTARDPSAALSWNLLGAVVGACAQSFSLLLGLKALLYVVVALYVLALTVLFLCPRVPMSQQAAVG